MTSMFGRLTNQIFRSNNRNNFISSNPTKRNSSKQLHEPGPTHDIVKTKPRICAPPNTGVAAKHESKVLVARRNHQYAPIPTPMTRPSFPAPFGAITPSDDDMSTSLGTKQSSIRCRNRSQHYLVPPDDSVPFSPATAAPKTLYPTDKTRYHAHHRTSCLRSLVTVSSTNRSSLLSSSPSLCHVSYINMTMNAIDVGNPVIYSKAHNRRRSANDR